MAKKTLASQQETHDAFLSSRRKLLYYKKDQDEIRYDVDPFPQHEGHVSTTKLDQNKTDSPSVIVVGKIAEPPVMLVVSDPVTVGQVHTAARPNIADTPVSAMEIVVAIIAQKLQKSFNEVRLDKTIKQLVGGSCFPFYH